MYRGKRVSVVMPVYNEEKNIKVAIQSFLLQPSVDEVIAVDNNSTDSSAKQIYESNATYINESVQGYGAALIRGMSESTGDLIVMVEPDGTFRAKDIEKLLIYSEDFEVVFGTRTSRSLIWSGANMPFFIRLGNWSVAKFLEYLFNGPSLTDVGCTYKVIHKDAYNKIKKDLSVTDSWFSPEFIIRVLQHGVSCVEVPVHYLPRVGESKITGKLGGAVKLGFRMIVFIIRERLFTKVKKES